MDASAGFLRTVIDRTRGYLDDPEIDAKYDDAFMVKHIISPAFASIASRINNSSVETITVWIPFPLTKGTAHYALPPCVGEVWRIGERDGNLRVDREAVPRSEYHLRGMNWKVEGNTITFTPVPDMDYSAIELQFMHNGEIAPFVATGTLNATKTTVTIPISATPSLGVIDRRSSAYAGNIMRLLPTSGVIEERLIESWEVSGSNFVATLRLPFTNATAGTVTFEMAPYGLESLYEAAAAAGALKLGTYRKISASHYQMIQMQYRDAMKTAMDHFASKQMRVPKYFERNTVDNRLSDWRNL